jgi:hypothetical protein
VVSLAIETDDEHGASMTLTNGLTRGEFRWLVMTWGYIANTLAEAAMAELVGATEKINGIIGIVRRDHGLHGAVMAIAEGQDVRPHALRV